MLRTHITTAFTDVVDKLRKQKMAQPADLDEIGVKIANDSYTGFHHFSRDVGSITDQQDLLNSIISESMPWLREPDQVEPPPFPAPAPQLSKMIPPIKNRTTNVIYLKKNNKKTSNQYGF